MGDDIRMDSAWWNGENVDDRSCTDPIEWSMQFTRCLLVSYYWMSDISTQLLLFAENPLFQVDYNDV